MMDAYDVENVEDVEDTTFQYRARPYNKNEQMPWQNKLDLTEDKSMLNRKVEIGEIQLKNDGYFSSHKEYKIVSFLEDREDEQNISRRYSDFEWLVNLLIDKYPGLIIPPLPEKNPLAKINKEDSEFQEGRKRGLMFFLTKMLEHQDLRFTPEFVSFLKYNDIEFQDYVNKTKKTQSYTAMAQGLWESIPSISSGLLSGIYNKFVDSNQIVRKSDEDIKIESYFGYLTELENTLGEMQEHARQMSVSENEQADTVLDLSNNLRELGKCYMKSNSLQIAEMISNNSEQCSKIQKEHSKYLGKQVEVKLKEFKMYLGSARESIQRRNALKEQIDKNDAKLADLSSHRNDKYLELCGTNQSMKEKLEEVTKCLLDELARFEINIIMEIDEVANEFMQHQIKYSTDMLSNWSSKLTN